jgi:ribosomal protein S18 acetylase RimI-like enzyme
VHDVYVDERMRRRGVAQSLVGAAIDWCRSKGMSSVVLTSAANNLSAQRLFEKIGFRHTMIEMTLGAASTDWNP